MAFVFAVAPGVRIRAAASRGIRAGDGRSLRAADGLAPVSFYAAIGGGFHGAAGSGQSGRGMTTGAYLRKVAAGERLAGAVQRLQHARDIAADFGDVLNRYRGDFRPASAPVVPAPAQPDRIAIARDCHESAFKGIGVLQRSARAKAERRAAECTEAEVHRQWDAACVVQAEWQSYFNTRWEQLRVNTLDVVIDALDEAYEHHETPSAAVGVDGDEVSLVVLAPALDDAVPEQIAVGTLDAGQSLQTLDEPGRTAYYQQFVCGLVVAAVREAFAVAPSLQSARVAVLRTAKREERADARLRREREERAPASPAVASNVGAVASSLGNDSTTNCLLAARFERAWLSAVDWYAADAARVVRELSTERLKGPGAGAQLWPIDLSHEPWLAGLIQSVDLTAQ